MTNGNYCVYRHRRLDKNLIFYIGIGSVKRAFSKDVRNNLWKKIISKSKYDVEIIFNNLSKDTAIELEMLLIHEYGRIDLKTGTLTNLTNGGEGLHGYVMTEEVKLKSGMFNKGVLSRRKRKVLQYDLNNTFVKEWLCIKTAEQTYSKNEKSKNITACCRNRQCTAYGFIWKYEKDHINKVVRDSKTGTFIIDTLTNKTYSSIAELAKVLNLNYSTLRGQLLKNTNGRFQKK